METLENDKGKTKETSLSGAYAESKGLVWITAVLYMARCRVASY